MHCGKFNLYKKDSKTLNISKMDVTSHYTCQVTEGTHMDPAHLCASALTELNL